MCTEWSIERQVLHTQCKRLEVQNYNLTRTAEQLSLTMGVSVGSQPQAFICTHLMQLFLVRRCLPPLTRTIFPSGIRQELMSQRQKVREERERLQAQLEHFRRCLTLPSMQWGRGQLNGHAPRWPQAPVLSERRHHITRRFDRVGAALETWQPSALQPLRSQRSSFLSSLLLLSSLSH